MADPLMYSEDHYVVLRPGQGEDFLTAADMLSLLTTIVEQHPQALPPGLPDGSSQDQAQLLLDRVCELELGEQDWLQWYAVRLEK